jgi:hypothetical protein
MSKNPLGFPDLFFEKSSIPSGDWKHYHVRLIVLAGDFRIFPNRLYVVIILWGYLSGKNGMGHQNLRDEKNPHGSFKAGLPG